MIFLIVIKRDPLVQIKIRDFSVKFIRLPHNYQSKIGFDTLIQIVILEKMINIMGATIVDEDIELKLKNSRKNYLGTRLLYFLYI